MKRPLPTIERLQELLKLNAETGELTWRIDRLTGRGRGRLAFVAGTPAGTINDSGYRITCIDYRDVRNHRIVFALTHGRWPEGQIDHINGDRLDNRPCNLRECSEAENHRNKRPHSASGLKGAYRDRRRNRWYSRIMVNFKDHHLGYFDSAEAAHAAYREAALRLHGEYARFD